MTVQNLKKKYLYRKNGLKLIVKSAKHKNAKQIFFSHCLFKIRESILIESNFLRKSKKQRSALFFFFSKKKKRKGDIFKKDSNFHSKI
jgi:hypothetical protein